MIRIKLCEDDMLKPEQVRKWILYNDKAVKRAAIVLYSEQDSDEKAYGCSIKVNDRGFNRYDSAFLQGFAEKCIHNWDISYKELNKARYKLLKYSKQIATIANSKKPIQYEWDLSKYYKVDKNASISENSGNGI